MGNILVYLVKKRERASTDTGHQDLTQVSTKPRQDHRVITGR